jgi:hypothetical protein
MIPAAAELSRNAPDPDRVLLKYPFLGGDNIEKAAGGLKHCNSLVSKDISRENLLILQQEAVAKNRPSIIT